MPIKREVIPSEKKHLKLLKMIDKLDATLPKPPFFYNYTRKRRKW